jgi:cytochrome bd-type quinol oxidase subunit 1
LTPDHAARDDSPRVDPTTLTHFPVHDYGPLMKGMVIGALGIFHVFVAQFAIGGGMLLLYFQWLAQSGREPNARRFLDGYFRVLVLVSFVAGALTGVGMWFITIQVSPQTIGTMVREFHWLWAAEWCFFALEVVAGYTFYRYGGRLDDRTRLRLLALYSFAAWMSLFWINGILSWQLTPGDWPTTRSVWDGFFNASFFPSLLFRTVVALTLAGLAACLVVNAMQTLGRDERRALIGRAARFLVPMAAMPLLGLWYVLVIPDDSRAWILGGSTTMTLFLGVAVGASLLIGGYAIVGLVWRRLYINGATATLLLALAFGATAGGEFVREGVRKPFTIREVLYSNAVPRAAVAALRTTGATANDPYPLRDEALYPTAQLKLGAKASRALCSVCHTMRGANGLLHLAGAWSLEQKRLNLAKLQRTKTMMPPFSGTPRELEAIVQLISWEHAGRPPGWPEREDPIVLERIDRWLAEAGTEPAHARASAAP